MAAGRGTRMIPLTDGIPKAMAQYNETTLIANGIAQMKRHVENVHVTVGYKKAMLAAHVIERDAASVFCTEGHGPAWWIYNTLMRHLDEPIFVLTCDNVVDLDFQELMEDYRDKGSPPCFLVPVRPIDGVEGDFIEASGVVVTSLQRGRRTDRYCSGIQIINPAEIVRRTEATDDFYVLWDQLMAQEGLLCSEVFPKRWYTADTEVQLRALNQLG